MKYLALLRGINVSGKNKIKMADFRTLLEKIGFTNVQTYIQSGNVVFESEEKDEDLLAQKINQAILSEYSYDIEIIVKTKEPYDNIVKNIPFLQEEGIKSQQVYLTFLKGKPTKENTIEVNKFLPDEFKVEEGVIYVFCKNGYSKTKLLNTFFEKKLGVVATTRNEKTVNKLQEMLLNN